MADDDEYDWVSEAINEGSGQDDSDSSQKSRGGFEEQQTEHSSKSSVLDDDSINQLESLSASPSLKEVKQIKRELSHDQSELSDMLLPLIEYAVNSADEKAERETDFNNLKKEVDDLVDLFVSQTENEVRGDLIQKLSQISNQLKNDELTIAKSSQTVPNVAAEIKRTSQIRTDKSKQLLENLINPKENDLHSELLSTIEELDESEEIQRSIGNITNREIKRRIDSVENDLAGKNSPLSQHLSERLNEFRQSIQRRDTNKVQKYAIYQEVSYYDRTLLPRLSRSSSDR